jgi:CheY-like chemotaxis protein
MTTEGTTRDSHPLASAAADLNEILRSAVQSRMRAHDAEIAFKVDLAESLPKVSIDSGEIERALLLVIANAEEAITGLAGRPGEIHLQTAVQGDRIQVTVTDNGRGMDWLEMSQLFGDGNNDELSSCAESLKDQGGDLYAWSSRGQGSIFTLEFPVEQPIDEKSLHGKRILVIDDEVHIRALMYDVLEQEGARAELASSGSQALEQIKRHPYDLFICDLWMPDFTGERLYRAVEVLHPELRDRFLFVTGDVLNESTHYFFAKTGVQYIRKPFRTAELVAAAEGVLSRNRRFDF